MALDVAVIGLACAYPGAPDANAFWRNIVNGVDSIKDVPIDRVDPVYFDPASSAVDRIYGRRGGFLDEPLDFEAAAFGIMPRAAEGADPDQLLALHVAARCLEDGGYAERPFDRARAGIVLGRGGYLTPGSRA
ncbi:MAG: beta-ketoacyl synthase N-terminal-like domain-containing protein [Acidobacteriota bacterium]